ncbi:MAG: cellulase family glycosylhydrolase [Mycobacterium sp.]
MVNSLSVPLLATVVIGASAGLYAPADATIPIRAEQIALVATIDTAADAVGVSESTLYFMSQSDLNTAMQQMQTMGITQVRVLLPWRAMEPADGSYSWTQSDQLLNTAKQYGIAVDACVTSTPTWASNYGLLPNGAPTNASDYASFVKAVAQRYGSSNGDATGKISSIEVWNEPNGFTGWTPSPNVQDYTNLLKAAYTAIKSVAPGITVVGGVLGAGITIGSLTINPVNFLQQMYADGAQGFFDALSFHPYNYTSMFSSGTAFANSAIKQLQALRALMNSNGDVAKLIWATEYGQPTTSAAGSQTQQAQYISDFLNTWSKLTGVGPMFLYSLIDTNTGSSTPEDNLGLFTNNWVAKAAAAVVQAWIAAHPTKSPGASTPGTGTGTNPAGNLFTSIGQLLNSVVSGLSNALSGLSKAFSNALGSLAAGIGSILKAITGGANAGAATKPAAAAKTAKSAAAASASATSAGATATPVGAVATATDSVDKTQSSSSDAPAKTKATGDRKARKPATTADSSGSATQPAVASATDETSGTTGDKTGAASDKTSTTGDRGANKRPKRPAGGAAASSTSDSATTPADATSGSTSDNGKSTTPAKRANGNTKGRGHGRG